MLRTPLRLLICSLLALPLLALAGPSGAAPAAPAATVKPIVFPVDGPVSYTDTWGAARDSGRTHEGTDIMGTKMQPLLAAVDGTVARVKFENTSSGGNSVVIQAADGWTYHYIHVNNDTPGTDDGKARREHAFPPNIVEGAKVQRGQVVAYMGDSGNAESTAPHLHFEIRQPSSGWVGGGVAINPYPSLRAATIWTAQPGWELWRSKSSQAAEDVFSYGVQRGDRALLCDWDGDGEDEPVIVRGTEWHLRPGLDGTTARRPHFGTGAEVVLCGNVDGGPADQPITFRNGRWTVYASFEPGAPVVHRMDYGKTPGDVPVVGDWDGDGDDDLAIYRGGTIHLNSGSVEGGTTVLQRRIGGTGDQPVAGSWRPGTVVDGFGIYRPAR